MPHLVDRDDDLLRSDGGIGEFARFVANPVQDGDVADPENPRYRAETHVAHRVEQRSQRLHRRGFAARRRHCEIATARAALVALKAADNAILHMIRVPTTLAADTRHGGPPNRSAADLLQNG